MNILITGGAGFIGSTLADELLAEGQRVIVVDNFSDYYDVRLKWQNISTNINKENYRLYVTDIENKSALCKVFAENKIDCVVHLAGRAGVRPSIQAPESYVNTNVLGTIHILELMKDFGVSKIVFASSSSVYGNCTADKFSEDLNVREPVSQYAATKSSDEQFAYTYSKLYNIKVVCLRFFTVYGPRQRPDLAINKFVSLIEAGKPLQMYGDGTTLRDYTYIDDVIFGIRAAIDYDATPYEIINIGGGAPVMLRDMIATIEKVLNKKAVIEQLPMQKGDVDKTVSDISKARRLLGYLPKTGFESGIRKFVEWSKRNESFAQKKCHI